MSNALTIIVMSLACFSTTVNSPHMLALTLIIISILLSIILSTHSLWFSFVLILVFTGGFMILTLYTITMTFTNVFSSPSSLPLASATLLPLFLAYVLLLVSESDISLSVSYSNASYEFYLTNMYSALPYFSTVIYLLLALLLILSMLKKEKMSMRLSKLLLS